MTGSVLLLGPHVRLPDFRHTVVSLLPQLKTPPHVVQRIARHADLDAMREALDSIEWDDP